MPAINFDNGSRQSLFVLLLFIHSVRNFGGLNKLKITKFQKPQKLKIQFANCVFD